MCYLTKYAYIYLTGLLNWFTCNFNSGNTCDLIQESNDVFDWTVQQGDTPSVSTGPNRDRGTGAEGYYIFIETSDPRVRIYCVQRVYKSNILVCMLHNSTKASNSLL